MTYYSTRVGIPTWLGPLNTEILYFANSSDLMDHLQTMYNCTANEIEFSTEWCNGELFTEHNGSIDAQFCENHNKGKIDHDLNLELDNDCVPMKIKVNAVGG